MAIEGSKATSWLKRRGIRRTAIRVWVDELKSRPCVDCGLTFPSCAMDFDHKGNKTIEVAHMVSHGGYSRKRIQEEIDKCDLVCACCHRFRTHMRSLARTVSKFKLVRPQQDGSLLFL